MVNDAESGERWSSSTSWIVADGSFRDTISLETSSLSIVSEDGFPTSIPFSVVLVRPPSADLLPCEITINFRLKKYEIYRVYVRSTARVYEVYYKSDYQVCGNEYLCTVRCGEASEASQVEDIEGSSSRSYFESFSATNYSEHNAKNDCSSDEDGWVNVNGSDSPLHETKKLDQSNRNVGVLYEATVEISDLCPCVSLTLRLLSLRTQERVHVEEIYIFADPVESMGFDSPRSSSTDNLGGNSVLRMLVPSLLQLSKSSRQNSFLSVNSGVKDPPSQFNMQKVAESRTPDCEKLESLCYNNLEKMGTREKTQSDDTTGSSFQRRSAAEDIYMQHCNHVEKVLDELVSKVGKIETFCSSFEQKLMKPLSSIESRLEQLERQFDDFVVRFQDSAPLPGINLSVSESSIDGSGSYQCIDNNCSKSGKLEGDTTIHSPCSNLNLADSACPEFADENDVVSKEANAPIFSDEDNINNIELPDGPAAPKYFEEYNNKNTIEVSGHVSSSDSLDNVMGVSPKSKVSLSMENALASALQAFLASASAKSSVQGFRSPVEGNNELPDCHLIDMSPGLGVSNEESPKESFSWKQGTSLECKDRHISDARDGTLESSESAVLFEEMMKLSTTLEIQACGSLNDANKQQFCTPMARVVGDMEQSRSPLLPGLQITVPEFSYDSSESLSNTGWCGGSTLSDSWTQPMLAAGNSSCDRNAPTFSPEKICEDFSFIGTDSSNYANSTVAPPPFHFLGVTEGHNVEPPDAIFGLDVKPQTHLANNSNSFLGKGFGDSSMSDDHSSFMEGGDLSGSLVDLIQYSPRWTEDGDTASNSGDSARCKFSAGSSDSTSAMSSMCELDGDNRCSATESLSDSAVEDDFKTSLYDQDTEQIPSLDYLYGKDSSLISRSELSLDVIVENKGLDETILQATASSPTAAPTSPPFGKLIEFLLARERHSCVLSSASCLLDIDNESLPLEDARLLPVTERGEGKYNVSFDVVDGSGSSSSTLPFPSLI